MPCTSGQLDGIAIRVVEDYESMSRLAAEIICQEIRRNANLLLCAATGNTPTRTYQLLAEANQVDPHPFAKFRVLKLDEWAGLAPDDPATCEAYLKTNLLDPLKIGRDRYFGCASQASDRDAECRRLDGVMHEEGPIDLCLLGLGVNGHLGFNEPAELIFPGWHATTLTPESRSHSMLRVSQARPTIGITLGMRDLLQSKHILLLVNGGSKRNALATLLERRVTTSCPASFLWLHSNVTLLCDQDAAAGLSGVVS